MSCLFLIISSGEWKDVVNNFEVITSVGHWTVWKDIIFLGHSTDVLGFSFLNLFIFILVIKGNVCLQIVFFVMFFFQVLMK